jgi:hypothetical protein
MFKEEMGRTCSRHEEKRNSYRVLEGKRPLRKYSRRWEDDIKMDLKQIGWCIMDWIHLPQERGQWRDFVNKVMKRPVP